MDESDDSQIFKNSSQLALGLKKFENNYSSQQFWEGEKLLA